MDDPKTEDAPPPEPILAPECSYSEPDEGLASGDGYSLETLSALHDG
jgi:hypothetical protein